jgi:metal-sulfur cluster biosynthetic enzyme
VQVPERKIISMSDVINDQVINALRQVQDPELRRDLVSLGMIKDVLV